MRVPMHFGSTEKGAVLTLILKGKSVQIREDNHAAFGEIVDALRRGADEDELLQLADEKLATKKFIERTSEGRAVIDDYGNVTIDGEKVHGTIVTRINDLMKQGLPFEYLLRFIERVDSNPSFNAREELYNFLDHKGLPITEDGCFLAYKAVRSDFRDKYSGTIDNSPGKIISMKRAKVDDNCNHGCSKGLHVGALDYVYSYGSSHNGDVIVQVKIDPADVVSVPHCSSHQKCRTCKYEVLRLFDGELTDAVYDSDGNESLARNKASHYDWSFADDDHDEYQDDYFDPGDVEVDEDSDAYHTDIEDDDEYGTDGYSPFSLN